jgi:hypothetical protein
VARRFGHPEDRLTEEPLSAADPIGADLVVLGQDVGDGELT